MAPRRVDASYETIRACATQFAPKIAANRRRRKLPPFGSKDSRSPQLDPERLYGTTRIGSRIA